MHAPRDNEPTKLQMLLLLLRSPGAPESEPAGVPLTVHLPPEIFARIDALSQHGGQSRNKVIAELIDVALADVARELNEEDRKAIDLLQREFSQAISLRPDRTPP